MGLLSWFKSEDPKVEADVKSAPSACISYAHAALTKLAALYPNDVSLANFEAWLNAKIAADGSGVIQQIEQGVLAEVAAEIPAIGPLLAPYINHPAVASTAATPTPAKPVVAAATPGATTGS